MNFVFAVPLHVGTLFSSLFEFIHTKFSFKSGFESLSDEIFLREKYVLSICRDFDGNVNTRICFI